MRHLLPMTKTRRSQAAGALGLLVDPSRIANFNLVHRLTGTLTFCHVAPPSDVIASEVSGIETESVNTISLQACFESMTLRGK